MCSPNRKRPEVYRRAMMRSIAAIFVACAQSMLASNADAQNWDGRTSTIA